MVRCADFYEKWKKDPNWCEKSPKAVEQIDHYLALVEEIADKNVDPIAIYKQFPEGATREVYNLKGDQRAEIVTNVAGKIKRGEKVSPLDIKTWLGIESKPTPKSDETKRTIVPNVTPDVEVKVEKPVPYIPVHVPQDVPVPVRELLAPVQAPGPAVEYEPHKVAPVTSPTNPIAQKKSAREFYAAELFNAWGKSLETFLITIRGDQPNLSQEMTLYNGVIALAESKKKR